MPATASPGATAMPTERLVRRCNRSIATLHGNGSVCAALLLAASALCPRRPGPSAAVEAEAFTGTPFGVGRVTIASGGNMRLNRPLLRGAAGGSAKSHGGSPRRPAAERRSISIAPSVAGRRAHGPGLLSGIREARPADPPRVRHTCRSDHRAVFVPGRTSRWSWPVQAPAHTPGRSTRGT